MAQTRHNPHFQLFPLNNARTGYQPFAIPLIYIEPDRVDTNGGGILNSEAESVRYYIANAPGPAKVAGPFNQNLLVPNVSLFEIQVSRQQLADRQIIVSSMPFFNAAGESIDFEDAVEGDFFQYTLESNDIVDKVSYYADAYYYDLSTITIQVETLPRMNRYLFIWESTYFSRVTTTSDNFKCIGDTIGRSTQVLEVNHPGEIHESYFKLTPGLYFGYEDFELSSDATLQFYRPFADVLQDVFDEQTLLDGINHINTIPAQYIPYLAYLIGWDIPNFPGSTDTLRRQILRKAVFLQKLKGSRRAIFELFEIFGYSIDLINLWASKDGNKFLGPNDGIPAVINTQVDACILNYSASGFTAGDIPLTFRPTRTSQLVLHAYLVNPGPALDALLIIQNDLSSDLTAYNDTFVVHDSNGLLTPQKLIDSITLDSTVLSHSTVKVGMIDTNGESYNTGVTTSINSTGISFDKYKNILTLNFDHELSVDAGAKLFVFAAYEREILDLGELSNTRSNRFDIEIVSKLTDKLPDFELFLFLLNFLFKLKAFHSILRKIKFTVNVIDVYNVNDFCINGKDESTAGTTLGEFQVSPAITPEDQASCSVDRGFKQTDLDMRQLILDGLENEFQGWKALSADCALTPDGQDKVLATPDADFDQSEDQRPTYCSPTLDKPDYCYKGRVGADLSFDLIVRLDEQVKNVPCGPNVGNGIFWTTADSFGNESLNYANTQYFDFIFQSTNWLVIKPESLQLEKDNLGFPSHRFLTMNRISSEVIIPSDTNGIYSRRPLDENLKCGTFSNILNAKIIHSGQISVTINSLFEVRDYVFNNLIASFSTTADALDYINNNGYFIAESLEFDAANLTYESNGLVPDVLSLSDHGTVTDDDRILTHNVQQATFSNQLVIDTKFLVNKTDPNNYSPIIDDFDYAAGDTLSDNITGPIFDSACINSAGFHDFSGGYPSRHGLTDIEPDHLDYRFSDSATITDTSIDRAAIAAGFGIDYGLKHTTARYFGQTMLFVDKSDAQYRFYVPYRLDCNCLYVECDTTANPTTFSGNTCNSSALFDRNGLYDPNPDKLEIDLAAVLPEELNTCNKVMNNDIPNLFCVNESCSLPGSGSFKYKDPYDIIYESFWIANEDTLDLTTISKDHRIPGMEDEGYVDASGRVFRKGIITTVRQIIKLTANSSYVDSEGTEVIVDFYQDNTVCCDEPFTNPFPYKADCAISDNVELLITNGPCWVDPLDGPDGTELVFLDAGCRSAKTYWADVSPCGIAFVDSQFIMMWIDPMSSNDVYKNVQGEDIDVCDVGTDDCQSSSTNSSMTSASTSSSSSP